MTRGDFHVHTRFCDGKASPEEMVRAALDRGMTAIGFSGHSHTAFDESWCMSAAGTQAYRAEIARLKEAYAGRIDVYCGVEQDLFSDATTEGYAYVIGSVHYLHVGGEYLPVDESAQHQLTAAARHFGGDLYAFAEEYYRHVERLPEATGCGVIGHFDLVTKFNEGGALFDESHPRYVSAWKKAADELIKYDLPFEINTGAMSRGYRTQPYPSMEMIEYIKANGGNFILSSDSHSTDTIAYKFEEFESLI